MMFMSRHTLTAMLLDICKLLLQLGAQHGLGRGTSLISLLHHHHLTIKSTQHVTHLISILGLTQNS